MKIRIFLIFSTLIVSVFGCSTLKGEYLNSNDIDIFINNYSIIDEIITKNKSTNADWENYYSEFYGKDGLFPFYFIHERYKDYYDNFYLDYLKSTFISKINIEVPEELDTVFENIGWKVDGGKKYWTISFGSMLLINNWYIEENYNHDKMALKREMKELDVLERIIIFILFANNYIENEKDAKNQIRKSKRVLRVINKTDLKIIKNRLLDLKALDIGY